MVKLEKLRGAELQKRILGDSPDLYAQYVANERIDRECLYEVVFCNIGENYETKKKAIPSGSMSTTLTHIGMEMYWRPIGKENLKPRDVKLSEVPEAPVETKRLRGRSPKNKIDTDVKSVKKSVKKSVNKTTRGKK